MEYQIPKGGFSFDNHARNVILEKQGMITPKAKKQGLPSQESFTKME